MMYARAQTLVQIGTGTLAISLNILKNPDQWTLTIRELLSPAKIGDPVIKAQVSYDQEVLLTFPTELQMLKVAAAFTNRSLEEMQARWQQKIVEVEAQIKTEWEVKS